MGSQTDSAPTWQIIESDCLEAMRAMPEASVDAIVCDPPYGLSSEPDAAEVLRHWLAGDDYQHRSGGFMGKAWDSFVPGPAVWREALRVLKPGGHLLAFFGTRTVDLGTVAIRLAGLEIRDTVAWMYGSGFPKSLDVSKAIDRAAGAEREVVGVVRKLDSYGVANDVFGGGPDHGGEMDITAPATPEAAAWAGWGTALKPAHEPIVVARKPLAGTVAANVLRHGTGALNIDGCRVGGAWDNPSAGQGAGYEAHNKPDRKYGNGLGGIVAEPNPAGRWPANVVLDDAAAAMLDESTGELVSGQEAEGGHRRNADKFRTAYGEFAGTEREGGVLYGDRGGASRFFYCAKASTAERSAGVDRNVHPTVKPIDLMRWLVRLVTPPDGLVLDPFTGSGTTGCAAVLEGFRFIGLEREAEYAAIARARIEWWAQQPRDVPLERLLGGDKARTAASERGQGSIFDVIESEAA